MDIMDLASKGIAAIAKNFGKKIAKQGPAPEIEQLKPTTISGAGFRAGFAREEIMPDLSDKDKIYWIAGHGSGHKMEGVLTPVYISAVWLDCGNDEGILWIGADIVGLTRIEVKAIRERILANPEIKGCKLINFSCTHSHSGIDTVGYWGKPNLVSIPSNGKDPQYMALIEEKAVEVAIAAYKNRKAGKLYNGRTEIKDGLATGRRFSYKHEILARFRFAPDDGSKEIWMLNFAAHPNSLGGDNRLLSAEYPYYLREKIAKENGADVLYAIGPLGGMDAARYDEEDRVHNIQLQGETIADAAMKIDADEELKPEIKFIQQPFYYPVGNYVLTLLAMRHVMSFKAYPSDKTDIGIAIESEMTYMTVGGQKLLLLPGENFMPTVYGEYLSAEDSGTGKGPEINPAPLADIAGDKSIIVFGVSNDMTGYVVPPNDFVLHPTQPYLNTTSDRLGNRHYHETNALDANAQKTLADTFAQVVKNFG